MEVISFTKAGSSTGPSSLLTHSGPAGNSSAPSGRALFSQKRAIPTRSYQASPHTAPQQLRGWDPGCKTPSFCSAPHKSCSSAPSPSLAPKAEQPHSCDAVLITLPSGQLQGVCSAYQQLEAVPKRNSRAEFIRRQDSQKEKPTVFQF